MNNLYFDVETIPAETHMIKKLYETIKPPASIKKPETIEKWHREQAPGVLAEKVHKLGLKPLYCQVICIGVRINDDPVRSFYGEDEFKVLREFLDLCRDRGITGDNTRWIGHNIINFDLPVLRTCCLRNRQFPTALPRMRNYRRPTFVLDTLQVLQHQYKEYQGLGMDDLAELFHLPPKTGGLDGSKVYEEYMAGNLDKIAEYCEGDVLLAYDLAQLICAYYL